MNSRELSKRIFATITTIAVLAIAGLLTPGVAQSGAPQQQEYKAPFSGKPVPEILNPTASVRCFSDQAAVTGFYRDVNPQSAKTEVFLQHSSLKSQKAGGGYKISLKGDSATVFDEAARVANDFQVYSRGAGGVILVRGRATPRGDGIEVITIDPESGSFVLADLQVGPLWNRTNVWVGRCY
ncbi:MAG: hypothetical protein L0387_36000 [Acidobacteria bacterium]|nr:hypothetical protein [Acidobacteriota bacterium]